MILQILSKSNVRVRVRVRVRVCVCACVCVRARVYTHQKVRSEASLPGEQTAPAVTPVLVYPAYRYDNLRNAVTIATAESLALAPCEDQNREKDDDNAAGYQLKDVADHIATPDL